MSESVKNLNEIVKKLREVDNVFKFGEKMIPVIEGFVSFITDFIPFIEQISDSIQDSRSKIPDASNQLNKVTNATELAMTEVLDKIDEINNQLMNINESMAELVEKKVIAAELLEDLKKHIDGSEEANNLINKLSENIETGLTIEFVKNKIREITTGTDQITMSLQVQDITAQQLAAVNHLIISVQEKLGGLLNTVNSSGLNTSEDLKNDKLPGVHFDADADYKPGNNQQNEVDSIIKSEKTSQEEIDKLFS